MKIPVKKIKRPVETKESEFNPNWEGNKINNLPKKNHGKETGNYFTDYYGCWHEVERKDGTRFFMIGEYPD